MHRCCCLPRRSEFEIKATLLEWYSETSTGHAGEVVFHSKMRQGVVTYLMEHRSRVSNASLTSWHVELGAGKPAGCAANERALEMTETTSGIGTVTGTLACASDVCMQPCFVLGFKMFVGGQIGVRDGRWFGCFGRRITCQGVLVLRNHNL